MSDNITELSPRERRRQKTRQIILETAEELVAEKGPEGLSIREIARRIDYSPAGLYEYFRSKEDLVAEVCTNGLIQLTQAFWAIPKDLPATEQLIAMSLAYARFATENPEQFLLIFNTLPSTRRSLNEPVSADSPYRILLDTIRDAVGSGEFLLNSEQAIEGAAYSLWALMHGRAMLEITFLRDFEGGFDEVHQWAIEIFIRGLKAK